MASARRDTGRRDLVANYYANVLAFPDVHHDGEDTLVFPLLRERATDCDALVERMEEQHAEALRLLEQAKVAVTGWSQAPGDAADRAADQAVEALIELADVLGLHLDDEEAEILPLAAEYLSLEEWGALPGHGMANVTGDKVWLILGLIRENFTPAQRQAMLDHMPPPARAVWENTGEAAYVSLMADVRRTA